MTKKLTYEDFGFDDENQFRNFILCNAIAKLVKTDELKTVDIELTFEELNDQYDKPEFHILKKANKDAFVIRVTFNEPEDTLQ